MFHRVTDIKPGDYITMQDNCGCCIVTKRVLFSWYADGYNHEPVARMGMSYYEDDPDAEDYHEDFWSIEHARFILNKVEPRTRIQYWEQTLTARPENNDSPEGW